MLRQPGAGALKAATHSLLVHSKLSWEQVGSLGLSLLQGDSSSGPAHHSLMGHSTMALSCGWLDQGQGQD